MTEENISAIDEVLKHLGLNSAEASVYSALLNSSPKPASVVAKRAGLKRPHTYNVLTQLSSRGLVQQFEKCGVNHFTCSAPELLLSSLEEKERELQQQKEQFRELLPLLKKVLKTEDKKTKVKFFQGFSGFQQVYEMALENTSKQIFGFHDRSVSLSLASDEQRRWMREWIIRRAEKNIYYFGIIRALEQTTRVIHRGPGLKRTLKCYTGPKLPAQFLIFDDQVVIATAFTEYAAVVIESSAIAETLRIFHQLLWPHLPTYPVDDLNFEVSGESK